MVSVFPHEHPLWWAQAQPQDWGQHLLLGNGAEPPRSPHLLLHPSALDHATVRVSGLHHRHGSPSWPSHGEFGMGVPGSPWSHHGPQTPFMTRVPMPHQKAVKKMLTAVFLSLLLYRHTGLRFICFLTDIFLYNCEIFILSNKRQ